MSDIARWFTSRIMNVRILALIALLITAIVFVSVYENAHWQLVASRIVCILWLVTGFRFWDDLSDREYDRTRYPMRVLSQLDDARAHKLTAVVMLTISCIMLFVIQGTVTVLGFVLLLIFLSFVYKNIPHSFGNRRMRENLILVKYPVFIALLSSDFFNGPTLLTSISVFLIVAAVDYRDAVTSITGTEKP